MTQANDDIQANSRSGASRCSAARDQKVECAECGVLTTPDHADFAEGDGGMIPDRWFCQDCQVSDMVSDCEDYEDDGRCLWCGGEGWIDGNEFYRCASCGGSGKRKDMTIW